MTNDQFLRQFIFRSIQYTHEHHTDFSQGCPRHYLAQLVSGKGIIRTDEKVLTLYPGMYFYIPKGLKYHSFWYPAPDAPLSLTSFGCDALPLTDQEHYSLSVFSCDEEMEAIFHSLAGDMRVNCHTIAKILELFSLIQPLLPKELHMERSESVNKALEYMQQNYAFSVKDVAEYCGVSESGLYYLFQKYLHATPIHIKNRILTAKAIDLLTSTDKSIEEISRILNFGSTSYFRRILRSETGLSPSQIRKNARL